MRIIFLWLFIGSIGPAAFCQGAHSTNFIPDQNGFHFVNTFSDTYFDQAGIKITVSGCSGGMSYAALDYYNRKLTIPKQSYPPADHELLYDYINDRQIRSLFENEEKWSELLYNPFGWQNNEFFNWGLQGSYGGKLQELKFYIDKGIPVPLGLFQTGDNRFRPHNQVVAIGYDCGRYQGTFGDYQGDFKIYCYNPAYPDIISTLQVNLQQHYYYWKDHENNGDHYMGYFVDTKYVAVTPPPDMSSAASLPDCNAHELVVTFTTGEDGLLGADNNCNLMLQYNNSMVQQFLNVNRGVQWPANTAHTVDLWIANPTPLTAFKNIVIYTKPCEGTNAVFCNNWNLNQVTVLARGGFPDQTILTEMGNPLLKRFSGNDFSSSYLFTNLPTCEPGNEPGAAGEPEMGSGTTTRLLVNIVTGDDDLQGGDNNLNLTISYRDMTSQSFPNVNAGQNWPAHSSNVITLHLNKAVNTTDILRMELQTLNCQSGSCDNWNFQGITIKAESNNTTQVIFEQSGNPIYRFTGSNNVYDVILRKN